MVSIDNNYLMIESILAICFFEVTVIIVIIYSRNESNFKLYFEKVPYDSNMFRNIKLSGKKSFIPIQNGCYKLKNIMSYSCRHLYPLNISNAFAIKYKDVMLKADQKINNCKLQFVCVKNENIAKYCAKNIINILYFKKSSNVLRFLTNIRLQMKLSRRAEKYIKYMLLEEVVIWIEKLALELKDIQHLIYDSKYYQGDYVKKYISGAEVYGLLRYNSKANIILFRNNVNIKNELISFFDDLKEYANNFLLLKNIFCEVYSSIN